MSEPKQEPNSPASRAFVVTLVLFFLTLAFYYIGDFVHRSITNPLVVAYLIGSGMVFSISGIYMLLEYLINGPDKKEG